MLASIVRSTADFGLVAIAGGVPTPELSAAAFAVGADLVHGRCQPRDLSTADVAGLVAAVPARLIGHRPRLAL